MVLSLLSGRCDHLNSGELALADVSLRAAAPQRSCRASKQPATPLKSVAPPAAAQPRARGARSPAARQGPAPPSCVTPAHLGSEASSPGRCAAPCLAAAASAARRRFRRVPAAHRPRCSALPLPGGMALDAADLPQLTSADLELLFKDPPAGGPYSLLDETAAWIMEPSPAGALCHCLHNGLLACRTVVLQPALWPVLPRCLCKSGGLLLLPPPPLPHRSTSLAAHSPPRAGSGVPDPATGMAGPAADWLPELPIGLDGTQLPRAGMLPDLFVDPLLGSQTGLQLPLPVHPADAFMPPLHADSSGAGASGSGDSQSPSHGNSAPAASIPASAVTAMTSGQRRKAGGGGGKAKELTEEQKERIKAKNRRCVPVGMFVGMLLGCGAACRGGECLLRFHSGSCLSQLSCRCA